jgi:hypothetical protein
MSGSAETLGTMTAQRDLALGPGARTGRSGMWSRAALAHVRPNSAPGRPAATTDATGRHHAA